MLHASFASQNFVPNNNKHKDAGGNSKEPTKKTKAGKGKLFGQA